MAKLITRHVVRHNQVSASGYSYSWVRSASHAPGEGTMAIYRKRINARKV